jgi:hypothetical protein
MAITSVKGKSCTFSIGTTSYTAWVTSLELNAEKSSETVSTWSEDVAYAGTPSYEGTVQFLFDPSSTSLGKAMETAFSNSTTISISLAQGTATRSLSNYLVTSYSESMPADGLVTGEAGLTGSSLWSTTYTT